MPTDKQRAAFFSATKSRLLQTKTKVAKDLEKAANPNKEEEVDVEIFVLVLVISTSEESVNWTPTRYGI